jgi:hypothetical protein
VRTQQSRQSSDSIEEVIAGGLQWGTLRASVIVHVRLRRDWQDDCRRVAERP